MRESRNKAFTILKTDTLIATGTELGGGNSSVGDALDFDNDFSYTYTIKKSAFEENPNWIIIYYEEATGDAKVDDFVVYDLDGTPKIMVSELYNTFTNTLSDPLVFNLTINSVTDTNVLLDVAADQTKLVITEPTVTVSGSGLSPAFTSNFTNVLDPPKPGFYIGDYLAFGPLGDLTISSFFSIASPGVEIDLGFTSAFTVRDNSPDTGILYRIFFTGYEYYLNDGRGELFIKEDFITRIIYDYGGTNIEVTFQQATDVTGEEPYVFQTYSGVGTVTLTDVITSSELDRIFKNVIKT